MTTWLLILLAVHKTNPNDIPGRVILEFESQVSCERSLASLDYWLKFESFKVEGRCIKKSSS
jgi:hypothetical protein